MKHEIIKFYPLQVWYVKHKHESQHDMDPNSNINYRRKIRPMTVQRAQKLQIPVSFHVMFMINIT